MQNAGQMRQVGLVADFKSALERRERRKTDGLRDELKRGTKRRLSDGVQKVRTEFSRLHDSLDNRKVHGSIERVLTSRRNQFLKAERRFHRTQPINDELLHKMRIAFKKFRYAVEGAQPVLGRSAMEEAREMHAIQQLVGEYRDVAMLRAEFQKWAGRKGKIIAIAPELDRLQQKTDKLLKKIVESSTKHEEAFKTETLKPVSEKTHAVGERPIAVPKV